VVLLEVVALLAMVLVEVVLVGIAREQDYL